MKRLDEIESMGMDEMLRISSDESVPVPDGLKESLVASLAFRAIKEERLSRGVSVKAILYPIAGVAAAVLLALFLARPSEPADTFDDPLVAYAEVEKVFSLMSDKIAPGVKSLSSKAEIMNRPKEIIERINDKNNKK